MRAPLPRLGIRLIQRTATSRQRKLDTAANRIYISPLVHREQNDYNTLTRWYRPQGENYDRVARSVIYAVYFATCIIAGIHYLHGWWHSKLLSNASSASTVRNLRMTRALFAYCFVPGIIINGRSWHDRTTRLRKHSGKSIFPDMLIATLGLSDSTITIVIIFLYLKEFSLSRKLHRTKY